MIAIITYTIFLIFASIYTEFILTVFLPPWKSRACLTPEGKATLTPENFFILTPLTS